MEKEFWHQRWESNEIGFNQVQPNELLTQYFSMLNLKKGSRVFVPLCGKSIDMLWLANQGYDIVGVELSSIACDAFFKENKISVEVRQVGKFTVYQSERITLLAGDIFDLNKQLLGKIDAVFDRAALIALPAELRQHYAALTLSLLEPGTPIFLISGTYNQNEMLGPPFSVDENEVMALYGDHFNVKQIHNQLAESISPHLREKGLTKASVEAYYLTSITE